MNCVKESFFKGHGGVLLHYYSAVPEGADKIIIIVHGFCEFRDKYSEMIYYLYNAGYGVYFYEQRGHGLSEREVDDKDVVHVNDFRDYVADLKAFMDKIVTKQTPDKTHIMFAHSMGGAVGTLFLEKYPEYFDRAILSSPMLKLRMNVPGAAVKALTAYVKVTHKEKELSFNQHHFDPEPNFEHSSMLSESRYNYILRRRIEDVNYQMSGGTYGWVIESIKATNMAIKYAGRLTADITVFQAGNDHLVDVEGYTDELLKKRPDIKVYRYADSKHEIFNATDAIRTDFYGRLLHELSR